MKIGLISDTHIPEAIPELWPHVFDQFRDVECILHAGDIYDLSVLDRLESIAPVYAARGNGEDGSAGRKPARRTRPEARIVRFVPRADAPPPRTPTRRRLVHTATES